MENDTEYFGLMELSHRDLLSWAFEKEELSVLEVELLLRLEEFVDFRENTLDKIVNGQCGKCIHMDNLIPEDWNVNQKRFGQDKFMVGGN